MVREWGMSERLGDMAWGPQGPVFLGEDLIHTRDYSDETARLIDEEVARMLKEQGARARAELRRSMDALHAVAAELIAHETLEAADIARILRTLRTTLPLGDDTGRRAPPAGPERDEGSCNALPIRSE